MRVPYAMEFLYNFMRIVASPYASPPKRAILQAYLRLNVKFLAKSVLKKDDGVVSIFNLRFRYFRIETLLFLFTEIFVAREYQFTTSSRRPVIVDCGSNVGLSVIFFKLIHPECQLLAFEPDPKTFNLLASNVGQLPGVSLFNKAIYNKQGTIDFYFDPKDPGSLIMSTIRDRLPKSKEVVEADILSRYITGTVDLLKMDVEGAEQVVMQELEEKGKLGFIREMIVEYHHHVSPEDDNLSGFLGILEAEGFGYQLSSFVRTPFTPRTFQDLLIYAYSKSKSG